MTKREEAIQYLKDLITAYPGRKADFYIPIVAAKIGVTTRKVSEYLKLLHEAGEIVVVNDRFYPPGAPIRPPEEYEQMLLSYLEESSRPVTHVTAGEAGDDWYLVVYDIKSNITQGERRAIYRRLKAACQQILQQGGEYQRIQLSVWRVKGRQNAQLLASAIPEKISRIKIFRITEGD